MSESCPAVWKNLYGLQQANILCDMQLNVQKILGFGKMHSFPVHKIILAASSSYFDTVLKDEGDLQNAYYINGTSSESLELLMQYIYRQVDYKTLQRNPEAMALAEALSITRHKDEEPTDSTPITSTEAPSPTGSLESEDPLEDNVDHSDLSGLLVAARSVKHSDVMHNEQTLARKRRGRPPKLRGNLKTFSNNVDLENAITNISNENDGDVSAVPKTEKEAEISKVTHNEQTPGKKRRGRPPRCIGKKNLKTSSDDADPDVSNITSVPKLNGSSQRKSSRTPKPSWKMKDSSSYKSLEEEQLGSVISVEDLIMECEDSEHELDAYIYDNKGANESSSVNAEGSVTEQCNPVTIKKSDSPNSATERTNTCRKIETSAVITGKNNTDKRQETATITEKISISKTKETQASVTQNATLSKQNETTVEFDFSLSYKSPTIKVYTLQKTSPVKVRQDTVVTDPLAGKTISLGSRADKRTVAQQENYGINQLDIKCSRCPAIYPDQESLKSHFESVHRKLAVSPKCSICGKSFPTAYEYEHHMRTTHEAAPFECKDCSVMFHSRSGLSYHINKHHTPDSLKHECDMCSKKFFLRSELASHMRFKHSDERPHGCQLCGRAFKSNSQLNRHLNTYHSDVRNYKCHACDKAFKTSGDLKKHQIQHSRDEPDKTKELKYPDGNDYPCAFCGKVFQKRTQQKTHERLQHKQKGDGTSYLCTVCKRSFSIKHYLMQHIKHVHMPRQAQCKRCHRYFMQNSDLQRHLAIKGRCKGAPSLPKPYVCPNCNTGFTLRGNLVKHLQVAGRCKWEREQARDVVVLVQQANADSAAGAEQSAAEAETAAQVASMIQDKSSQDEHVEVELPVIDVNKLPMLVQMEDGHMIEVTHDEGGQLLLQATDITDVGDLIQVDQGLEHGVLIPHSQPISEVIIDTEVIENMEVVTESEVVIQ